MENFFSILLEDIRHERSLTLLLSISDPDIFRRSKFTEDEISIIRDLALEKIYRQKILKKYHAVSLLE